MEQQQRSLVFTAAVGLIILAIIVGSIYYLVKFIQTRVSSSRSTPSASVQIAQTSGNPSATSSGQVVFVPAASNAARNIAQASTAPRTAAQASAQPQAAQGQGNPGANTKFYNAGDFQLTTPKNWGLLKCNNSDNLELDPTNSSDTTIACDIAVKPVTVVVGDSSGCAGESVKLGGVDVLRTRNVDNNYIKYQWCTKTSPVLNITHRVSQGAERATSKQDFSKDVEDIISKLTFVKGS